MDEKNTPLTDAYIKGLQDKKEKLIRLLLLTDPAVSDIEMSELTARQWQAYCTAFPDEQ
jgi:hypothetical protein